MSRNVQVVVLCEDRQHAAFTQRFLARAGKNVRVQRIEISPKGRGSGERFVRERYAKELAYYRARKHRVEQALIVLLDADGKDVAARVEQVESTCVVAERRQGDERVAIFVPARNIETWFAHLEGQTVNQNDRYPRLKRERDCQRHVECLNGMCQQGVLRKPSPPSLEAACEEYHSRLQS